MLLLRPMPQPSTCCCATLEPDPRSEGNGASMSISTWNSSSLGSKLKSREADAKSRWLRVPERGEGAALQILRTGERAIAVESWGVVQLSKRCG